MKSKVFHRLVAILLVSGLISNECRAMSDEILAWHAGPAAPLAVRGSLLRFNSQALSARSAAAFRAGDRRVVASAISHGAAALVVLGGAVALAKTWPTYWQRWPASPYPSSAAWAAVLWAVLHLLTPNLKPLWVNVWGDHEQSSEAGAGFFNRVVDFVENLLNKWMSDEESSEGTTNESGVKATPKPKTYPRLLEIQTPEEFGSAIRAYSMEVIPWAYLYQNNRALLRNLVRVLAAKVLEMPADQVGREELLRLTIPLYETVEIPGLGRNLKSLYDFFQRKVPGRTIPTHHFLLQRLFQKYEFVFPTIAEAYSLKTLQQIRSNGDLDSKRVDKLWEVLPLSAQRALIYEIWPAMDDAPPRLIDFRTVISPTLGRTLKGMMAFYGVSAEELMDRIQFVRSPQGLQDRARIIQEGFAAFRQWSAQPGENHPFILENQWLYGRIVVAADSTELRRVIEEALRNADRALAVNPERAAIRSWRDALVAYWGLLDSVEFTPRTFGRAVLGLRERAGGPLPAVYELLDCEGNGFLSRAIERAVALVPKLGLPQPPPLPDLPENPAQRLKGQIIAALERFAAASVLDYHTIDEIIVEAKLTADRKALIGLMNELIGENKAQPEPGKKKYPGYRLPLPTHEKRPADPRIIFWHGRTRAGILADRDFRRDSQIGMLAYLWGPDWKERVENDKLKLGAGNKVYEILIGNMFDAYEMLREHDDPVTAAALFAELKDKSGDLLLDDADTMTRALEWLERKGFALRREAYQRDNVWEAAWVVRGLARERFLDLDVAGWPAEAQNRWQATAADARWFESEPDPALMDQRLDLILDLHGVSRDNLPEPPARGRKTKWTFSEHQPDGVFLDSALEATAFAGGFEAIRLRAGLPRFVAQADLLRDIREKALEGKVEQKIGKRIRLLRQLAGLSVASVASALRMSLDAIRGLEADETELTDARLWKTLAILLGADIFVILSAVSRSEALAPSASLTFEDRVLILSRAQGLTLKAVHDQFPGGMWTRQIDLMRRGFAPDAAFAEKLSQLLKANEEDTFGAKASGPVAPIATRAPKAGGDPRRVYTILSTDARIVPSARSGIRIKDYLEILGPEVDASASTLRRTFDALVDGGYLLRGAGREIVYSLTGKPWSEEATQQPKDVRMSHAAQERGLIEAKDYFNRVVSQAPELTPTHIAEWIRLLLGEPANPRLEQRRIRDSARAWAVFHVVGQTDPLKNLEGGLFDLANAEVSSREMALVGADLLYKEIALKPIDLEVIGLSAVQDELALLIVKYFLYRNGWTSLNFPPQADVLEAQRGVHVQGLGSNAFRSLLESVVRPRSRNGNGEALAVDPRSDLGLIYRRRVRAGRFAEARHLAVNVIPEFETTEFFRKIIKLGIAYVEMTMPFPWAAQSVAQDLTTRCLNAMMAAHSAVLRPGRFIPEESEELRRMLKNEIERWLAQARSPSSGRTLQEALTHHLIRALKYGFTDSLIQEMEAELEGIYREITRLHAAYNADIFDGIKAGPLAVAERDKEAVSRSILLRVWELGKLFMTYSADWTHTVNRGQFQKGLRELLGDLISMNRHKLAQVIGRLEETMGEDRRLWEAALNHLLFLELGRIWIYEHRDGHRSLERPRFHDAFLVNGIRTALIVFFRGSQTGISPRERLIEFNEEALVNSVGRVDLAYKIRGEFYSAIGLLMDFDALQGGSWISRVVPNSELGEALSYFRPEERVSRIRMVAPFLRQVTVAADRSDMIFQLEDLVRVARHASEPVAWAARFDLEVMTRFIGKDLLNLNDRAIRVELEEVIWEKDVPALRETLREILSANLNLPADGNDKDLKGFPKVKKRGRLVTTDARSPRGGLNNNQHTCLLFRT